DSVPLYEGKMVQGFDHRAASVETVLTNLKRPGQPRESSVAQHADPSCYPSPQYWVSRSEARERSKGRTYLIAFKSVTSPTNERTVIASALPECGAGNSLIVVTTCVERRAIFELALLANLNALVL